MFKISVLLPTYNGALYIEKAIKSVLEQSYTDWELIILDDASIDDTGEICKKYAKADSRIRYIRNETNLRLPGNLNKGLSLASGVYIARIDEDDVWIDPEKLKKQVEVFGGNKDCVLVGTSFGVVGEDGGRIRDVHLPTDDAAIRGVILSYNPFCHSSVMFKKEEVTKIGGYDSTIKYGEDYDLWLRLGRIGSFAILPTSSVKYLQRASSMSGSHTKMRQIKFHIRILTKYGMYYPNLMIALLRLISYAVKG